MIYAGLDTFTLAIHTHLHASTVKAVFSADVMRGWLPWEYPTAQYVAVAQPPFVFHVHLAHNHGLETRTSYQ